MNLVDLLLIALTAILFVVGVWKGAIRILVGLASLVVAWQVAVHFHQPLAALFRSWGAGESPARIVAYVVVFLGVMLAGGLVAWLLRNLARAAMLGWADRLAGGALAVAAAALASAFLLLPLVAYLPEGPALLCNSTLAPYVAVLSDVSSYATPADLSERYGPRIERLRRIWRGEHLDDRPAPSPSDE